MQETTDKPDSQPTKLRLTCDSMLGKLSRELRMLGVDTDYRRGIGGMRYYKQARSRGRTFLTRSNRLKELPDVVFIESNDPAEQLEQVRKLFALPAVEKPEPAGAEQPPQPSKVEPPSSRCLKCNVALERISREQARPLVPFFIYQIHHDFSRCPKCRSVFWPGSHVEDMAQRSAPGRTEAPPERKRKPARKPGSRPWRGRRRNGESSKE